MDSSASSSVGERKRAVRRAVLAERRGLPPDELAAAGAAVVGRLLSLPEVRRARALAAFVSGPDELQTGPLLDALAARGTVVLLPVLLADDSLDWRRYAGPDRLVPGRRGTLEPTADAAADAATLAEVDVVVVPGVCYDAAGRRLGRGGGSYDRALAALRKEVLRVGVALDSEIMDAVPAEPHDQPVDVVVTPTRTIRASGG